jgi:four helix bundle protein
MATVKCFEDLEIWKLAREICQKITAYTNREPFCRDFSIVGQIRKSSGSIMDNIAEGYEREGNREFIQFLSIAKGSGGECRSQTYRAFDSKYLSKEEFEELLSMLKNENQKIRKFIQYFSHSDFKGQKFKEV